MKFETSPLGVRVASAWVVTSELLKSLRFIKYLLSADGGQGLSGCSHFLWNLVDLVIGGREREGSC